MFWGKREFTTYFLNADLYKRASSWGISNTILAFHPSIPWLHCTLPSICFCHGCLCSCRGIHHFTGHCQCAGRVVSVEGRVSSSFWCCSLNRYCLPIFPSRREYIEVTLSELHIGTSLLPFVVLVTREVEEGHSEANSNFSCFTGAVKHLDIGVEGHSVTFLLWAGSIKLKPLYRLEVWAGRIHLMAEHK